MNPTKVTKTCTRCNAPKQLSEFNNHKENKDGHQMWCKECAKKATREYNKTIDGLVTRIYATQRRTSKKRNHPLPNYTRHELKEWILSQPNFQDLWDYWVFYGYRKKDTPSCDRTDDYKPYTLDNLRLVTWRENWQKGQDDIRNGINNKKSKAVIGTHKETGEKVEFYSMSEAERKLKVWQMNISACCLGKRKSAGGYVWRYA